MKASINCINLIKHFESLHDGDLTMIGLQPKMCPSGIWTEGWGHAMVDELGKPLRGIENKNKAYKLSKIHNDLDASAQLEKDIALYDLLIPKLGLNLTQAQYDSLVSFAYNCGYYNLKTSTLLKYIQQGRPCEDIYNQFLRWVKGEGGITLPGLIRRRKSEALLYTTGLLTLFE